MPISPHRRNTRTFRDAVRIYGGARTLQRGNTIQASQQGDVIIGDPYNNTVANQVGMVWDQSAGTLVLKNSSIEVWDSGLQTVDILSTGVSKWGSNLAAAATTTFAIFTTADTYNSESMGAGDVLIGDNTTGGNAANVFWDASAKDLLLREGITNRITLDNAGDITISRTTTATAESNVVNFLSRLISNPGGASSANLYNIEIQSYTSAGNAENHDILSGIYPSVSHKGTGTVAAQDCIYADCYNITGGTITDAAAGRFKVQNTGAGTVTGGAAIETALTESAGEIVTGYDIRMKSGTGQATTQWGLYQDNANSNYLAGSLAVGDTSTAAAQLHVDNPSAARPVLYLDQGDVSEEMIEFASTIGVGNAIETTGGKTLTTTHFIKITLPGALTRYIPCGTIA